MGRATTRGPEGRGLQVQLQLGYYPTVPCWEAVAVTLCPGQSPFQKFPQGSDPAYSGAKVRPWREQCFQS